jgi:hypothetical protein
MSGQAAPGRTRVTQSRSGLQIEVFDMAQPNAPAFPQQFFDIDLPGAYMAGTTTARSPV